MVIPSLSFRSFLNKPYVQARGWSTYLTPTVLYMNPTRSSCWHPSFTFFARSSYGGPCQSYIDPEKLSRLLTRWLLQGLPSHQTGAIPIYLRGSISSGKRRDRGFRSPAAYRSPPDRGLHHALHIGYRQHIRSTKTHNAKLTHRLCASMALRLGR